MEKNEKKNFFTSFFQNRHGKMLFWHILEKIQQNCCPANELPAGCGRGVHVLIRSVSAPGFESNILEVFAVKLSAKKNEKQIFLNTLNLIHKRDFLSTISLKSPHFTPTPFFETKQIFFDQNSNACRIMSF